jgi:hypothetical protein
MVTGINHPEVVRDENVIEESLVCSGLVRDDLRVAVAIEPDMTQTMSSLWTENTQNAISPARTRMFVAVFRGELLAFPVNASVSPLDTAKGDDFSVREDPLRFVEVTAKDTWPRRCTAKATREGLERVNLPPTVERAVRDVRHIHVHVARRARHCRGGKQLWPRGAAEPARACQSHWPFTCDNAAIPFPA